MQVINLSALKLLKTLRMTEWLLPRLLRGHNLRVVHIYLVYSVVQISPENNKELRSKPPHPLS